MEFLRFHDRAAHRLDYIIGRSSQLLEATGAKPTHDDQPCANAYPEPSGPDEACACDIFSPGEKSSGSLS
jgi:hypothetical protein